MISQLAIRRGARHVMVLACSPTPYPETGAITRTNLDQRSRSFSSRKHLRKRKDNPFKVLEITEETSYSVAKRKFLQIAMNNHPDTCTADSEEDRDRMRDVFISARIAFEQLCEAPDGSIMLVKEAEQIPNFDQWFHQQTGHKTPFDIDMSLETMKEVAEMTNTVGGGLDRDGGMWTLAKMVTNSVNSGGDAQSILRLESGDVRDRSIDGELRRRRRK